MQNRQYLNFEGITISSYEYGEFDKIFNILSPDKGIITAIIKRIRKTSNNNFDYIDIFQKMNFKASLTDNFCIIYDYSLILNNLILFLEKYFLIYHYCISP